MPRSILIVDANPGLAGMLQQAFAGAGFSCAPALTAEEAVRIASSTPIDLAIVDFHVPDADPADLVRALRALRPGALLLGIPLDNNPDNPILDQLGMQGGLFKPYYLPKLVQYVAEILGEPLPAAPEIPPEESPAPANATGHPTIDRPIPNRPSRLIPWLEDTGRVSAYLAQIAVENPVVACMLTRGQDLRAWTGELSREQLSLVARKVAETWANVQGGTLTRYVRLPLTDRECFLYSTSLTVDLDLTLLFDPKTPVSVTRKRSQAFLTALGKEPPESVARSHAGEGAADLLGSSLESPLAQRAARLADLLSVKPEAGGDEYPPSRRLPPGAVPQRTAVYPAAYAAGEPLAGIDEGYGAEQASYPEDTGAEESPERQAAIDRRLKRNVFRVENPPPPDPRAAAAEQRPVETTGRWVRFEEAPQPDRASESSPTPGARLGELPVDAGLGLRLDRPAGFETPTPALVKLAYSVVLTPTFPGSRLTSEMASDLNAYLRNLAVSYGWKALRVSVQSGHAAVTISAPPHVAPAFIIRVLRRNASQRLFSRFPALADANPAPDFWAPGYLLIGSDEAPTPQQINDYISYTRRAQGLAPSPDEDDVP